MKMNHFRLSAVLAILALFQFSCSKTDGPDDQDIIPADSGKYIVTYDESKLVSDLNGYRFEAAYGTTEPENYPYLWVQYVDDYLDSTRTVVLNQNNFKSITKHIVGNHFEGKTTRKFDHGSFPNDASNSMSFSFNHPMFLLNSYDAKNGAISETGTVFGINTQVSHIFTGMYEQYSYQFLNRFIIRYISGTSLWPFNYPNWSDEPQFIATSELSAPKAVGHYFDESFSTFPYDVKSNMYSGFFQSTYDGTYVGISKGSVNLDTILLNTNPPEWYDAQICKAYIDKIADTIYLGVVINIPNTIELQASLYKMDLNTNNLTEIYSDVSFPYGNAHFKRGSYYAIPNGGGQYIKLNKNGQEEIIPLPVSTLNFFLMFSKNKIFAITSSTSVQDIRTEIYSKPF